MSIYIYSRVSEDMPSDAYLGVNSPLTDPPGPPRKLSTNINISEPTITRATRSPLRPQTVEGAL